MVCGVANLMVIGHGDVRLYASKDSSRDRQEKGEDIQHPDHEVVKFGSDISRGELQYYSPDSRP